MPPDALSCLYSPGKTPVLLVQLPNFVSSSTKTPFRNATVFAFMPAIGLPNCAGLQQNNQNCSNARLSGSPLVNTCTANIWVVPYAAYQWPQAQACSLHTPKRGIR